MSLRRLKLWIVIVGLCAGLIIGVLIAVLRIYEGEQQRVLYQHQEDLQKMTDGFSRLIGGTR
jgi:uncharacterized membrane-anchored protein YhcB (DUF1043 family)